MKVVLVGSVQSTRVTLDKLVEHGFEIAAVYGCSPKDPSSVSGFVDLRVPSEAAGVPFRAFNNINDHADEIRDLAPDAIFIVGLSQLVTRQIIGAARKFCVGFHPTKLPAGRGRAPVAWMILRGHQGAASFFQITEGIDAGPLFSQTEFAISEQDNAGTVYEKIYAAMKKGLDAWLPQLKSGVTVSVPQNEESATYFGKRTDGDGLIDWRRDAYEIERLVRAASDPHPGAFTFCADRKIRIWEASAELTPSAEGVVGGIVAADSHSFTVQCGSGHLRATRYSTDHAWRARVGQMLGYRVQDEIFLLRSRLAELESRFDR